MARHMSNLQFCNLSLVLLNLPLFGVNELFPAQSPIHSAMPDHPIIPALERITAPSCGIIPSDTQCHAWWNDFAMLDHIKAHSQLVAEIATELAHLAVKYKPDTDPDSFVQSVRAAALLHDLGKTYSIKHGGNHCQYGAAWTMQLTGNPAIAQGVMHHVCWPGVPDPHTFFLPLALIYADKRVMHDQLVSMDKRFEDLLVRYGRTDHARTMISASFAQGKRLETILGSYLKKNLETYFPHCQGQ